MAEFVRAQIFGTTFEITSRYSDLQPVGMGAFGLVCSARDQLTNQNVAVKKIMKPFSTPVLAKRTYRELKLLKHLRHENIISLSDIFISPLEDIYFVTELLGTDLHRLLTARPLEKQFIQYFLYQIMRGLKYVHSAGVVHRDLKPSNILVNENCDLKICDFGLARIQDPQMTGYVSTRYYRAPEIMLTWQKYDVEVDIWSAGCIFAEMLEGKPLFPGKDHVNQFSIITDPTSMFQHQHALFFGYKQSRSLRLSPHNPTTPCFGANRPRIPIQNRPKMRSRQRPWRSSRTP
jgi:p38 MAP kinase